MGNGNGASWSTEALRQRLRVSFCTSGNRGNEVTGPGQRGFCQIFDKNLIQTQFLISISCSSKRNFTRVTGK